MSFLFRPISSTLLLTFLLARLAGADVAYGELHGTVYDPADAVVPAATITIAHDATGFRRQTQTDARGEYRFLSLAPAAYTIRVEKDRFQTAVAAGVLINLGQIAILDVKLTLGSVSETLTVEAGTGLLESERGHQANHLDQKLIENLPINRRDYLTYTLLLPGIVDSNALADNTDLRVKATPHSGLSFYGSNGRGNSLTLDGHEANDGGGGVRNTVSQEAVQEFQVNRSNYSAEMGSASGGAINIVSRTGSNDVHGSAFGFFRHDALDAGDPFARVLNDRDQIVRVKPPSQRQQFGAAIGGPLRRDRTFFYTAFEGLVRRESAVVSLVTDKSIFGPTKQQEAVLAQLPASAAVPLRAALTSPPSTVAMFTQNSGVFPYSTDSWKFSARLDHRAGDRNQIYFRHNFGHDQDRFGLDTRVQRPHGQRSALSVELPPVRSAQPRKVRA